MEEHIFDKVPELEILLESRSFSDLTESEKERVLEYLTQEEYDTYRNVILESRKQFVHEMGVNKPGPELRTGLLNLMSRKKRRGIALKEILNKVITYRIPVYQPAFTIAILVILFFTLNNKGGETVRYIAQRDTVYLESPAHAMPQPTPSLTTEGRMMVKAHKVVSKMQPSSGKADINIIQSPSNQYIENAYQKIRLLTSYKAGHTALEDSALMKLLVAAY